MGALPRLKRKIEYQYRKGSTNEARNCQFCMHLIRDFQVQGIGVGINGPTVLEPRCKIIGMVMSRRYRIRLDHTCNAHAYKKPSWIGA